MISYRRRPLIAAILAASASTVALADDAPAPPPPQDTWIGKGQAGFLESKGNSNAESINANVDLSRFDGAWKNEIYFATLYGKNNGIVSAERYEAREQTNYNFTPRIFAFGGLRSSTICSTDFSIRQVLPEVWDTNSSMTRTRP